ncbi:MAG: sulfatase [Thermodesulfovibrionales bacterium]|nr:sulfatase [Thermodesulfovibrionales bacterium]
MNNKLPNIVLIVCDTLGAKHMSLHGYHRKTTPSIERMVEEEGFAVYTKCFSPATWTTPSHASLFTGLYPTEHNTHGGDFEFFHLSDNFYSLPEVLKGAGYKTAGISSNFLVSKKFGFARGFDEFIELDKSYLLADEIGIPPAERNIDKIKFLFRHAISDKKHWRHVINKLINILYRRTLGQSVARYSAPYTKKTGKLFLDCARKFKNSNEPFFIFMNLMETHGRYIPPKEFRNRFTSVHAKWIRNQPDGGLFYKTPFASDVLEIFNGLYDEEVLFLDSILYKMYLGLKQLNMLDNTLFIITSDHGEALGEHNHFGHMFSIYNEVTHVPLMIHYPYGSVHKGEISNLVQTHDLYSTIIEAINVPLPLPVSSVSLVSSTKRDFALSVLVKREMDVKQLGVHDYYHHQIAYVDSKLRKLIVKIGSGVECFDLNKSFYENYQITDPQIIKELLSSASNLNSLRRFGRLG